MKVHKTLPLSLIIIAVLWMTSGVLAVIKMMFLFMQMKFIIDFNFLGIFIGPGLLMRKNGWRICALVFVWLGFILLPIVTLLLLFIDGPLDFKVLGQKVGEVPKITLLPFVTAGFAFLIWEYHVLTRPDIKALFGVGNEGAIE